ncbi:hypothetical protein LRP88_03716 [Fusarium phalaenopsidis]
MQDAQQEFPLEESTADCAMAQPDTDSGYGGSSNASNQTHDDHLDPEASSTASSSCSRPQPPSDTGTIQAQPQPIRIRPIKKKIDIATARRANDVIEQMSLLLQEHMVKSKRYKYLSRPKRNPPPMSIRPIVLGTTEEDAKTCLVIFCTDSHGVHEKIKDFLRKSFVKELYQPRDSTEHSFDVHVVGAPPSEQAGVAVGIPINNPRPETSTCTLCGTSIYFVQEKSEQKQFATMGGILRLEFPDGTNDLYGLTAEHGAIDPRDPNDSDTSMSDGGSDYGDSSSRPASPTIMVQIDFDLGPCLDVPTRDDQEMHSEVDDLEPVMARVELSALENTQNGAFRDWALFPLPTRDLKPKPNMLQLQGQPPKALKMPDGLTEISESRTVQIITGSGLKRATLAPCLSRVLLKPGTAFVWALTVELQTNSDIRRGDSGSWVVDPLTLEVYGHLVATDVLMGAYVIPLVDIIDDIRSRFYEVSVQFPSDHLLHPKDEAMRRSLARDFVARWEDTHHPIPPVYDRNLYGSNSVTGASTIDGTEPPASVFSQPISTTTAASSSMDWGGDGFKLRASETIAGWTGFKSASMGSLAPRVSRPAPWKASSMRKMARLYTYTTLSLAEIMQVIYSDQDPDLVPGIESANKKIHTLLDKQPRWIHPRNEEDMGIRLRELAKSPFRQKQKRHKSNSDVKSASARNVSGQETIEVLSTDQGTEHGPPFEHSQRSTACPPKSSIMRILSDYSSDYVNDVEMLMSRYSLEETLDAEADSSDETRPPIGVSTRDNLLHDANAPAAGRSKTIVSGDFLHLDEVLVGHEPCGQELNRHDHRLCLCRVGDEVGIDDWVTASGPTPKASHPLDAVLSEDMLQDNPGASVGEDGRSDRRPQTDSSFQMLSQRKSVMEELLVAGVNPNHYNGDGNTVLMTFAARLPEDDDYRLPCQIIATLVKAGAHINARNRMGETALHIAVRTGHKLVTRALVEAGANVYARDGEGRSVLDVADITALHSKDVKDYAHAEAARAWLSGLQARAVQNPTVKQEWGMGGSWES